MPGLFYCHGGCGSVVGPRRVSMFDGAHHRQGDYCLSCWGALADASRIKSEAEAQYAREHSSGGSWTTATPEQDELLRKVEKQERERQARERDREAKRK